MNTFLLEIVTPERVVFSNQVEMVTVPSVDGVIGILPHHINLFSRLTEGEVKITKEKEEFYLAIGGGYIEVTKLKTILLVSEAYHAHEISENELLEARKRAQDALSRKPSGVELQNAQALFRRTTAGLKVVRRRRGLQPQ